jgi:hypothetical protein
VAAAAVGSGGALALSSDHHMTSSLFPLRTPSRPSLPAPDLRRPESRLPGPSTTGRPVPAPPSASTPAAPDPAPPSLPAPDPPVPPRATLSTLGPLPAAPAPFESSTPVGEPPPAGIDIPRPSTPTPRSPRPERHPGGTAAGALAAAGALRWIVRALRR